jgi:hypothetical protein
MINALTWFIRYIVLLKFTLTESLLSIDIKIVTCGVELEEFCLYFSTI